jgi:CAAX protease family protein
MATDLAVRDGEGGLSGSDSPAGRPRPKLARALLPLALVALTSLTALVGSDALVTTGLVALTVVCAVTGHPGSARLGLGLTATVAASALLPSQVDWWPLPGLVGVGVYVLSQLLAGRHRAILRLGRMRVAEALIVVGMVAASASVLYAFSRLAPPRLGTGAQFLIGLTPWSLVAAGVAFAVVNAFVEEVLFRGAILHHLGRVLGNGPAVLVQALAFGALHLNGYPYGVTGVGLASAYGLVLGALRLRSGGLLAPWVAHVCADAVIFVLIAQVAT